MKKTFYYGLMAIALAAFSFGGVSLADTVAQIGGTGYTSLSDAINNAQSGDTVILLEDVSETISLTTGKSITLNLSGHKITIGSTAVSISAGILTVEGNGSIDVTSKGANVFNVVGGKLIVKNGVFTGGGGVYVKGNGSEATIIDGRFIGLRSGNSALMHATNSGTLTIVSGYFEGAPTTSGKPQKVIYAGGNGNYCDSRSTIQSDPTYRIGGTVVVKGGTLVGRVSLSNGGIYDIQRGTFTLYGNLTAGVGCDYSVCESDGTGDPQCNDNAPGIENMLGEGYVGVPKGTNEYGSIYEVVYDPVATIGENGYSTVIGAINAAQDNDVVKILKAGTYDLPATISHKITIEGAVAGVKFTHGVTSTTDQIISTINEDVVFSGITFIFNGSVAQHHFAQANAKKITMKNCIIDGIFHVRGAVDFIGCTFKREETTTLATNLYNLHINYGNVNFDNCTFINNNSKNINIAYGGDATYNIDFKNTKFRYTAGDPNKPAVLIHEVYKKVDYGYPNLSSVETYTTGGIDYVKGKWNITFDSATEVNSTYGSTFVGGSQLFGLEDVYSEDGVPAQGSSTEELYGSTNGGEVVVSINGTTVYSTPKHGQTWTVTFDGTGAVEVADGAKVAKPADPTKSCYRFDGWYDGNNAYDFNSVVTSDLTLTSHWTYNCGGGSSSSSRPSNNTSSNTGNNNTGTNNTGTVNTGTVNTGTVNTGTVETGTNNEETANQEELKNPEQQDRYDNNGDQQEVLENGLTREMNNAYEFAYRAGITTMETIEDAKMEEGLTRIAMAKMLSQYAINVLGKTPADIEVPAFEDVPAELDAQYDNGVTLAYKLGIMGQNMPNNKFLPNDLVTRAQFGTALSRLLFGIEDGEDAYYTTHLAKLKDAGIISNDDPTLEELRGYVMLMLMRSTK